MTETNRYKVSDDATQFVAGQRVPDDRIMVLTEQAARYDVGAGNLELIEDPAPETARKPRATRGDAAVEA